MRISLNQKNLNLYSLSTLLCVLGACGQTRSRDESVLKDSILDSTSIGKAVELGTGYSEKNGSITNTQCVTGVAVTKNLPTTSAEVSFVKDGSYRQITEALSGALDISMNIGAIQASAGASIAKKVASSELSTNIVAFSQFVGKATSLPPGTVSYAPGISELGAQKERFCGTDYISQIDYGAFMMVALEISAKTKTQKVGSPGTELEFAL